MSSDEKEHANRDRESDNEEDSTTSRSSVKDRKKRRKKHSKSKKKKKKRKNRSDSDSDEDSRRHHKRRRRHESSEDDSRSYDISSEESRRRKHRRKRKDKKQKKKKKRKKHRKEGYDSSDSGPPTFGKHGIIRQSDYYKMQRSFEVWMAEVKGIPSFSGSKRELQNYFAEYAEDYNTATLPHKKYYNYDKWEMEEYQKKKQGGGAKSDEARLEQERMERAQQKQQAEMDLVRQTMSHEKVLEMKRQQDLRSQMQTAFKMGDMETYERLKERLGPEK